MDNPLLIKGLVFLLLALWAWDIIRAKHKKQPADPAIAHADARERHAWRYVRWGFRVIQIACVLYVVWRLIQILLV